MTETKVTGSRSLAGLKRRIVVGTRLLCIENTYRPVLNGTFRTVVKVQTVSFAWTRDGDDGPRSWTEYPKASGLSWVDDDTFRLHLFDDHYVTIRFVA